MKPQQARSHVKRIPYLQALLLPLLQILLQLLQLCLLSLPLSLCKLPLGRYPGGGFVSMCVYACESVCVRARARARKKETVNV